MSTQEYRGLIYKNVPDEDFIAFRENLCDGCGKCAIVCPSILWSVKGGKARLSAVYKEQCLECGACMQACGPDAIEFDFPSGGTGIVVKYG